MNQTRLFPRIRYGLVASLTALAVLGGCASGEWGFPYRPSVQQGNWITAEDVALLQKGMTEDQVRFALGSPTLKDMFHPDRWDYPYYFKPGYGDAVQRKFSVWFVNDRVDRWEGDEQPSFQPFKQEARLYRPGDKAPENEVTDPQALQAAPAGTDSNAVTTYPMDDGSTQGAASSAPAAPSNEPINIEPAPGATRTQ